MCYQKKQAYSKNRKPKTHQLQAGIGHAQESASYDHSDDNSTSEDSFCLQIKIKQKQAKEQRVPKATHLITNLAYRLMPASMYQLVFKDPKVQKLTPSNLQVGTYTTDSVKIVGSCKFHLVHLDTKKAARNNLLCSNE